MKTSTLYCLIFRRIFAVLLFLAAGITLSFSQKTSPSEQSKAVTIPEPQIERADTFTHSGNLIILKGNVIIRIPESDTGYYLIKTEEATYDKGKRIISAIGGTMERFNFENNDLKDVISFDTLKFDVATNRAEARKISGKAFKP